MISSGLRVSTSGRAAQSDLIERIGQGTGLGYTTGTHTLQAFKNGDMNSLGDALTSHLRKLTCYGMRLRVFDVERHMYAASIGETCMSASM